MDCDIVFSNKLYRQSLMAKVISNDYDISLNLFVSPGKLATRINGIDLGPILKNVVYSIVFNNDYSFIPSYMTCVESHIMRGYDKLRALKIRIHKGEFKGLTMIQVIDKNQKLWNIGSVVSHELNKDTGTIERHYTGDDLAWLHYTTYYLSDTSTKDDPLWIFKARNMHEVTGYLTWIKVFSTIRKELVCPVIFERVSPQLVSICDSNNGKKVAVVKTHVKIDPSGIGESITNRSKRDCNLEIPIELLDEVVDLLDISLS